jgi:hypothetical protein
MVPIIAAVVGLLFFSIFPTVTYLYVEKRARPHWGDVAGKKAPAIVRATAWFSLALGQLGLIWLVLPVVCGGLVLALSRVGHGGAAGYTAIVLLGVLALVQSITSFGLVPFGIRVLARNSGVRAKARGISRVIGLVNVAALGMAATTYGMMLVRGILHPIIKVGLVYGVALPVSVFALVSLVLAGMMSSAATASAEIDRKRS